jgi:hypothetical protein
LSAPARDARDELAEKYPSAAAKASTSKVYAVKLFCLECIGGSAQEAKCCDAAATCRLWRHIFHRGEAIDVVDELNASYPSAAAKAKTSRAYAIKLECIRCFGGSSRDAKVCPTTKCWLWPHAYRRGKAVARGAETKDSNGDEEETEQTKT